MFDLEKMVAEWRSQMLAAGIQSPATLDELESHLREEVGRQMRSGLSARAAFEISVQQIGRPQALQNEFAKVAATTKREKMKNAIFGFLGLRRASSLALTAGAQKALELGGREAIGFHHDFVGTEHVLLGLLDLETGVVPGILQKLGVDHLIVRREIEKLVGPGAAQPACAPPYTPRAKKALALASHEAKSNRNASVRPEHIFLGLLLEGGGVAALVLKKLGVNPVTARQETLKALAGN